MNVQLEAGGSAVGDKEMAAILAQDKALAERKELVRKQKEKAMAQMQSMQRKFLEKNRQQMLDLEGPEVDEPYVSASSTFPFSFLFPLPSVSCPQNLKQLNL